MEVLRLEAQLAARCGRAHAVLMGSARTGLFALSRCYGWGPGSRVLYPSLTCPSAVEPSLGANLVPVFADVCADSLNTTAVGLREAVWRFEPRCVVVTHLFGYVAEDLELFCTWARRRGVVVFEDAAQALGGEAFAGERFLIGGLGDASVVSFGPGKLFDCGAGGAVLTDDEHLYRALRSVRQSLDAAIAYGRQARASYMAALLAAARERGPDAPLDIGTSLRLRQRHLAGFVLGIAGSEGWRSRLARRLSNWDEHVRRRRVQAARERRQLKQLDLSVPAAWAACGPGMLSWRTVFVSPSSSCSVNTPGKVCEGLNVESAGIEPLHDLSSALGSLWGGEGHTDMSCPVATQLRGRLWQVTPDVELKLAVGKDAAA